MGLASSPAYMNLLMSKVIKGMEKFCRGFVDDIIVFSKDMEEHVEHLRLVFTALRAAKLRVNFGKSELVQRSVDYCGFNISAEGIAPKAEKVAAIKNYPSLNPADEPLHKKQARIVSFLGLAGFYRRFIKDFARIEKPLRALTHRDAEWKWDESCETAFENLKEAICKDAILAHPRPVTEDPNTEFRIETDASTFGLGCVLNQKDSNGELRTVYFASRSLSPTKRNCSASALECLCVVWAVELFRPYINDIITHLFGYLIKQEKQSKQYLQDGS
jgi:hypothetical protein